MEFSLGLRYGLLVLLGMSEGFVTSGGFLGGEGTALAGLMS